MCLPSPSSILQAKGLLIDAPQVTKFFSRIYAEGDRFELLFTSTEGKPARRTHTYSADTVEELTEVIARAEAASYNVYASVMPLNQQETGLYDRVWLDQDTPDAPYPFSSDERWEGASWPMPNTLVKTSDGGEGGFRFQAIWLLDEPLPEADARHLIRRLAKKAGADESVHDPRRVLRVPGAMNAKRKTMSRLMETSQGTVSAAAFDLPDETLLTRLLDTDVNDPKHVLGEWLGGVPGGDRARKAYVCARFLYSCNVSHGDAAAIMLVGAQRSDPPLSDRELLHTLDSAYHRGR